MLADIHVELQDKQVVHLKGKSGKKKLGYKVITVDEAAGTCGVHCNKAPPRVLISAETRRTPPTSPIPTTISEIPYHTPNNKYSILRDQIHFIKSSSLATFFHWAKPVQELGDDVGVPMSWGWVRNMM